MNIEIYRLSAIKSPKVYHAIVDRMTLCGLRISANNLFVMTKPNNPMYRGERVTCQKCISKLEDIAIQNCKGPDENGVW
jgi:hypothetical protein